MTIAVRPETPLQPDVEALFEELNAYTVDLTPADYRHHLTTEQVARPDTTLFVARNNGEAVGCGALKRHDGGVGEIKRMFTRPAARGQGVGAKILGAIIDAAKRDALDELVLETGSNFDAALRLYQRAGFVSCDGVLDYPPSPYTAFFRKPLQEEVSA